jgi:hypothetical protein
MPIITPVSFDPLTINLSPERDRIRTPGIHLTAITKDMLLTSGINRAGRSQMSQQEQHLTFEKGFLWERIIEAALQAQMEVDMEASPYDLIRPGEVQMDGIYMTPDAINIRRNCVEEWKSTAMRSANFDIPTRRIEWLWQAGAYARYFGMTKATFRVWHHAEMPPVVTQFDVEWTPQEIEDNWRRILDHYQFMLARQTNDN